jgi:hypothetical protein
MKSRAGGIWWRHGLGTSSRTGTRRVQQRPGSASSSVGGRASACRRGRALEVRDRASGRMRADAVVVPTVAGRRYIVSMFGTISDWVHNLDAAHGGAVIAHGGTERVRLVLVPPNERAPILQEYVRVASSGRKHFALPVGAPLPDFATIAAQYPGYRIEVPESAGRAGVRRAKRIRRGWASRLMRATTSTCRIRSDLRGRELHPERRCHGQRRQRAQGPGPECLSSASRTVRPFGCHRQRRRHRER